VVVIGGGASGVLTAHQILRQAGSPVRVRVVEPRAALGRGVAFATTRPHHLLDTRAGALGALPGRPEGFAEWARHRDAVGHDDFLPRSWYGEYLATLVGEAEHVRSEAVDILPEGPGARVVLANGSTLDGDRVVLAPGASPPRWPAPLRGRGRRWIGDPWARGALAGLRPTDPVLLVGTGLTAVDAVLDLGAAGHEEIVAVSRHGFLPLAHDVVPSGPRDLEPPTDPSLATLVAWSRRAASRAGDWRPVVDALGPRADRLWGALSEAEQRRFLRHLRRRWEVARHRMAPAVAARIDELRSSGRLTVVAGGVWAARSGWRGVDVHLADRRIRVGAVVNCSGPAPFVRWSHNHLVRELLASRVVRPGPLGLGLESGPDGSIPGSDGRLWLVGPLRRGTRWEVTAVPEIGEQAAALPGVLWPTGAPVGV